MFWSQLIMVMLIFSSIYYRCTDTFISAKCSPILRLNLDNVSDIDADIDNSNSDDDEDNGNESQWYYKEVIWRQEQQQHQQWDDE